MTSQRLSTFAARLLAPAFAVVLAGCPGSLESPERFNEQFGNCPDIPTVFQSNCALAGCHTGTLPAGGLNLSVPDLTTVLSGKMAMGGPGLLIDPMTPAQSVLYTKLTDTPPFLSRMPLSGAPLDDSTQACVLDWIQTSAKGSP